MKRIRMEQTQFPPRQCHIDEHTAVLNSVAEVRALLAEGNTGFVDHQLRP